MKCNFKLTTAIILALMLFVAVGCGDDDGLPYWIQAHDSTIDLQGASEDGLSMITATIFDYKGDPAEDGTMFFTLNASARGYFIDEDGLRSHTFGVDMEDGVAEVYFYPTLAPETVTITAYGPAYPRNNKVSTTVRVFNSALFAKFSAFVDENDSSTFNFYDESGFPDGTLASVTWSWNFGDGTTSTLRDPSHAYAATGDYIVTLTVNGTSTTNRPVKAE